MGGYVIILFYCITCIVSALYMLNTGMYGGEAYSVGRVHFSFIEIIIHLLIVVFGYFYIYPVSYTHLTLPTKLEV